MTERTMQPGLSQFAEEHQQLTDRITDLRLWIQEVNELGVPHFGELGDRLQRLQQQLYEHFAHEERGYLDEALNLLPEQAADAEDLVLEHTQLLNQLNALICRLHEVEPPFESWQQAAAELDALLATLHRHESRELGILNAAVAARR